MGGRRKERRFMELEQMEAANRTALGNHAVSMKDRPSQEGRGMGYPLL